MCSGVRLWRGRGPAAATLNHKIMYRPTYRIWYARWGRFAENLTGRCVVSWLRRGGWMDLHWLVLWRTEVLLFLAINATSEFMINVECFVVRSKEEGVVCYTFMWQSGLVCGRAPVNNCLLNF